MAELKIVNSEVHPLEKIFSDKFDVDFYQREYVWQRTQIEDLINDLSGEFLKCYKQGDKISDMVKYDPYYMGEIVLSTSVPGVSKIIDGQQRITTLTLILIYLLRNYKNIPKFPASRIEKLIYSDDHGEERFNLDIEDRREVMYALYKQGEYVVSEGDKYSIKNLVDRYNDIEECWNSEIDESNVVSFTYWIMEQVMFSKVWTNSNDFAYVIFETMNDRGLSLTQVEMVRSYLLANIDNDSARTKAMNKFDAMLNKLISIKLSSKSKAEFEFFKMYLRGHYAEDFSQAKNSNSDFVRIGKEFHRWLRDNELKLGLETDEDFVEFINKIDFFAKVYEKINNLIQGRNTKDYLYLIVNADYNFTLQVPLILSAVKYQDTDEIVEAKIKVVSKYLSKVLSFRVWNHWMISQSTLENPIYNLCKRIRDLSVEEIASILDTNPLDAPELNNSPTLNQQNRSRLRVLLSLITEIVAANSGESDYMLNKDEPVEVEHIWSNHFEEHTDEFSDEDEFANVRNNIGDLLVLPKSFNASYGDDPYSLKVKQYFSQNILAQTLNKQKYENNPGFVKFKDESKLEFESYDEFKKANIAKRAELYKQILIWNWKK